MTTFFTFLFDHGTAILVGVIPLVISMLLSLFTTSWRRWGAILLALISGGIFAFELFSGSLEGNLTGLVWMTTTPFVAIAILVLLVIESSSRRTIHRRKKGATP